MRKTLTVLQAIAFSTIVLLLLLVCNLPGQWITIEPLHGYLTKASTFLYLHAIIIFWIMLSLALLICVCRWLQKRTKEESLETKIKEIDSQSQQKYAGISAALNHNIEECAEIKAALSDYSNRCSSEVKCWQMTANDALIQARSSLERQNRSCYLSNKRLYKIARKANAVADQEIETLMCVCEKTKYN